MSRAVDGTRRADRRKKILNNAAVRDEGLSYSRFIDGVTKAGITLNRKALSNMAIEDPKAFKAVVEAAKKALA